MNFFQWIASLFKPRATPVPTQVAPEPTLGWTYDDFVISRLTPAMIKADPGDLLPAGTVYNMQKFWCALIKATAKAESGFDPTMKYIEKFPDSQGNYQVSQGLLQLSLDDAHRGVMVCSVINPTTILQAGPNLACGIGIMDQLIRMNREPTLRENLGRYWSTIRDHKVDADLKAYLGN